MRTFNSLSFDSVRYVSVQKRQKFRPNEIDQIDLAAYLNKLLDSMDFKTKMARFDLVRFKFRSFMKLCVFGMLLLHILILNKQ